MLHPFSSPVLTSTPSAGCVAPLTCSLHRHIPVKLRGWPSLTLLSLFFPPQSSPPVPYCLVQTLQTHYEPFLLPPLTPTHRLPSAASQPNCHTLSPPSPGRHHDIQLVFLSPLLTPQAICHRATRLSRIKLHSAWSIALSVLCLQNKTQLLIGRMSHLPHLQLTVPTVPGAHLLTTSASSLDINWKN